MTDAERIELLILKNQLTTYLETLHQQIIDFRTEGDDEEFAFLITKAKTIKTFCNELIIYYEMTNCYEH